ncbi:MAG: TIGR01212 family radical SAM protein [Bacilli bacterium]
MFKYTLDNKRYHTLNYYNKTKYGCKVFKVSLNAGFSCPNKKNGTGCIYCYNGSGENDGMDLLTQFYKVRDNNLKKWPNAKYIGYFQAGTNTYADVNTLKSKYEPILKLDNVIGLNIATRCDALNNDVLDYLEELNNRTDLIVELGLQTIHESTSKLINRGHTLNQFEEAVLELRKRNINVVVHIINGLPFETKEMMLDTVKYLNKLDIQGIKIHMLFILKDTPILNLYNTTNFHILSKEEYIDIVIDQLELLRPEIVIHRITGDPIKELLVEPTWLLKKFSVLDDIDKEMVKRDSYQGKRIQ